MKKKSKLDKHAEEMIESEEKILDAIHKDLKKRNWIVIRDEDKDFCDQFIHIASVVGDGGKYFYKLKLEYNGYEKL